MGGFLKFVLQLVGAAVIIFVFTAVLVCVDGLVDQGEKADAALVVGRPKIVKGGSDLLLDRVIKLYNEGDFTAIMVNDTSLAPTDEKESEMVRYLENHGIESSAIVPLAGQEVPGVVRQAIKVMKARQLQSVMVMADYYRITRIKLTFYHEGISGVNKAHVGIFRTDDSVDIAHEVVVLYDYVARNFVLPMVEKVTDEAKEEVDKAKADAGKAKKNVDKGLDSLPK